MTRALLSATFAATLAGAVAAASLPMIAVAMDGTAASSHRDRVLMRRKVAHRASRGTGTGIVTGGKPTATGGTPGGMPDRQ